MVLPESSLTLTPVALPDILSRPLGWASAPCLLVSKLTLTDMPGANSVLKIVANARDAGIS